MLRIKLISASISSLAEEVFHFAVFLNSTFTATYLNEKIKMKKERRTE